MFVTCEELGKTLDFSVRFFKDGNWTPDESNDLLSDYDIYDGGSISAEDFESLKLFLKTEEENLSAGGYSDDWLNNMTLEELGYEGIDIDVTEGVLE